MNTTPYPGDPERILLVKILDVLNAGGGSGGGSGTVTSFSAGALSPLFTTSVATATSTPALSFALDTQNANKIFAGPTTGADAAPTFRAMVNADLGTTLTPQFLRLGVGMAPDANIPLVSTRPSGGAGVNVLAALLDVTTSNPQLVLGVASNQAGVALTYDRGTGRALLSMFGVGGLAIDNSGNASFTGGTLTVATSNMIVTAGVYSCQGNSGLTTTFDGTNTVTVTGGLITGVA